MPRPDETVRTFIAVEIPAEVKAGMRDVQAELRKSGADVGWVRADGIHLTLKFLGGIEAGRVSNIAAGLADALRDTGPFTLTAAGTGVFPNLRSPRVVWLGVHGDLGALQAVYEAVVSVCEGFGFEREDRAFSPHLTLGRVKSHKGVAALSQLIKQYEDFEAGSFIASSVSVMKSELKPSGAVYTEMARIQLKGE